MGVWRPHNIGSTVKVEDGSALLVASLRHVNYWKACELARLKPGAARSMKADFRFEFKRVSQLQHISGARELALLGHP